MKKLFDKTIGSSLSDEDLFGVFARSLHINNFLSIPPKRLNKTTCTEFKGKTKQKYITKAKNIIIKNENTNKL